MNTRAILGALSFLLSALLVACSPSAPEPPATDDAGPSPAGQVPGDDLIDRETLPPLPILGELTFHPPLVEAGGELRVSGDPGLQGTLHLTFANGEGLQLPMEAGQAALSLPETAPPGPASAFVQGPDGSMAAGAFRVVDGPGLWLTAERAFAAPGQMIRLRVQAYGMPEGLKAFLERIPPEPDAEADPANPAAMVSLVQDSTQRLAPTRSGRLAPAPFFGAPLEDFLGRDLLLPAEAAGDYRLFAADTGALEEALEASAFEDGEGMQDPQEPPGFTSNVVSLALCRSPGSVEGDLGGPGWVHVVPLSRSARALSQRTEDGRFRLQVQAGAAFVIGTPEGAAEELVDLVQVPCGSAVTALTMAAGSITGRAAAGHRTANVAFQPPRAAQAPPSQGGGSGADICRSVLVLNARFEDTDQPSAEEQAFGEELERVLTALLQERLTRANVTNGLSLAAILMQSAQRAMRGEESGEAAIEEVGGILSSVDYLVTMTIFQLEPGSYYVVIKGIDKHQQAIAALQSHSQVSLETLLDPETHSDFVQQMVAVGLCGQVDVAHASLGPEGEFEFQVKVTDLAGEGVSADLEVQTLTCGKTDPGLPAEIPPSGEMQITFKGVKDPIPCVETLRLQGVRRDAPLEAYWPKTLEGEMDLVVAVWQPQVDLGVGAMQGMEAYRTEPLMPLAAITIADDYDLQGLTALISKLEQKGRCNLLAPIFLPTRGQAYDVASSQPRHSARAQMTVAQEEQTGAALLELQASAQAAPADTATDQPITLAGGMFGEPFFIGLGYAGIPVLFVVDVTVDPQLAKLPVEVHVLWEVEGETTGNGASWNLSVKAALLECAGPIRGAADLYKAFASYRTLVEATSESGPARAEWVFELPAIGERLQLAMMVMGGAGSASQVFTYQGETQLVQGGSASMRARMEVIFQPVPQIEETSD